MKIKNIALLLLLSSGVLAVSAQGGQRRTVEEKVKSAMEKIAVFNLDKEKSTQIDSVFTGYYKSLAAKREEMRANGSMDREKMRDEMQKLGGERDEKLKKVLSEDQFKKWKDEIEPSLRPQRLGGGNQ